MTNASSSQKSFSYGLLQPSMEQHQVPSQKCFLGIFWEWNTDRSGKAIPNCTKFLQDSALAANRQFGTGSKLKFHHHPHRHLTLSSSWENSCLAHKTRHQAPLSSQEKTTGKQIKPGKMPEDLQGLWALAGWLGRWGACSPGCCSPAHRAGTLVPNRPHPARPRSGWSCSSSARAGSGLCPVEQTRSSWWDFLNSESSGKKTPKKNHPKSFKQGWG